jgi:hypothetical protein
MVDLKPFGLPQMLRRMSPEVAQRDMLRCAADGRFRIKADSRKSSSWTNL